MSVFVSFKDVNGKQVQGWLLGRPKVVIKEGDGAWRWRVKVRTFERGKRSAYRFKGRSSTEQSALHETAALLRDIQHDEPLTSLTKGDTVARGIEPSGKLRLLPVKRDCLSGRFSPDGSKVNDCIVDDPKVEPATAPALAAPRARKPRPERPAAKQQPKPAKAQPTPSVPSFDSAMNTLVRTLTAKTNGARRFEWERGRTWAKVWRRDTATSRSIFAFVDVKTGAIHNPASAKKPYRQTWANVHAPKSYADSARFALPDMAPPEMPARQAPVPSTPVASGYAHEIPADLARRAFAGTSHSPEERGASIRADYDSTLRADREALEKLANTDAKRKVLDEAFSKYHAGYRKRFLAYLGAHQGSVSTLIAGPAKFPVRRQQKINTRIDKRSDELRAFRERSLKKIRKLLTPEKQPIQTGATDAQGRIGDKLSKLRARQERMKAANVIVRSKLTADEKVARLVAELGFKEALARSILEPDELKRVGFADYELKNNGAEIRRLEARAKRVDAAKSSSVEISKHARGDVEVNRGENRVRIKFPGKPDEATRTQLKKNGFRWTPSLGVWQAYVNNTTVPFAKAIVSEAPSVEST